MIEHHLCTYETIPKKLIQAGIPPADKADLSHNTSPPAPAVFDPEAIRRASTAAQETVRITPVETLRRIGNLWLRIGKRPDSHQFGKNLNGKTIPEIVSQISTQGQITVVELGVVHHEKVGPAHTWEISALGGRSFIIEKSKYVWVDTSDTGGAASYLDPTKRVKAGAGPIIYQVAQAYARNTGKTFTPDPAGVSEIALPRRWAQMLSSATRFGDVSHIDPYGADGCELPGWSDGKDTAADIGRLAFAESEYVKQWIPEMQFLQFSSDFSRIYKHEGNITTDYGNDTGRAFEGLLTGRRDPSFTGIGETTLRRALITHLPATRESFDAGITDL